MDRELMEMAISLASIQIKANATIATQDPNFDGKYLGIDTLQDIVSENYDWLKKFDADPPNTL